MQCLIRLVGRQTSGLGRLLCTRSIGDDGRCGVPTSIKQASCVESSSSDVLSR